MEITKEQFLQKCVEFEELVHSLYSLPEKGSAYAYFSNIKEYEEYKDDINVIRALRNTYVHNNTILNNQEGIDVKPIVYNALLEIIDQLKHPKTIESILSKEMVIAHLNSNVWHIMKVMKEKNITHIPVLANHKIRGVFSENTVFQVLMRYPKKIKNLKIKHILNYCSMEANIHEAYDFISIHTPVPLAQKRFIRQSKKRMVMLFVTENGKADEDLLGLLTAYDFIK